MSNIAPFAYVIKSQNRINTCKTEEEAIRQAIEWSESSKDVSVYEETTWTDRGYTYTQRRCIYIHGKRVFY